MIGLPGYPFRSKYWREEREERRRKLRRFLRRFSFTPRARLRLGSTMLLSQPTILNRGPRTRHTVKLLKTQDSPFNKFLEDANCHQASEPFVVATYQHALVLNSSGKLSQVLYGCTCMAFYIIFCSTQDATTQKNHLGNLAAKKSALLSTSPDERSACNPLRVARTYTAFM